MSGHRSAASAEVRDERPPQRNLAAGKRLAPLPPGLRSRVKVGGAPASSSTSSAAAAADALTKVDFAQTAPSALQPPKQPQLPQRSSSKARGPLATSSGTTAGSRDGRRRLSLVQHGEHNSSSFAAPVASSSSASSLPSRQRTTDAAADPHRSRRASGNSLPSAGGTSSAATAPRTGPRASTSEGMRRPSPQRRDDTTATTTPRDTLLGASARVGRQQPRAPVLARTSATTSAVGVASTHASVSIAHNTASIAAALRTPAHAFVSGTATTARAVRSFNGARATSGASEGAANDDPAAAATVSARSTDQHRRSSGAVKDGNAHPASASLPYAPHDMEASYYADPTHWTAKEELPALVRSLLDGAALEAPYTTSLWTQAYADPAELLPTSSPPLPRATDSTAANTAATHDGQASLPAPLQHRDPVRRQRGFYACVRCATPVCSPAFQAIPASSALRGIAVFARLHLNGVDLRVGTGGSSGSSTSNGTAIGDAVRAPRLPFPSSTAGPLKVGADTGWSTTDALLQGGSGGVRFIAHCHHCSGCLGVMFIGDAIAAAAVAAAAAGSSPFFSSSRGSQRTPTYTQELLCVNSACLQFMLNSTHAALDGELLGAPAPSAHGLKGSGAGVTMRSLFGPARTPAWGEEEDEGDGNTNGKAEKDGARESAASSFSDMLEALNPYNQRHGADESDSD